MVIVFQGIGAGDLDGKKIDRAVEEEKTYMPSLAIVVAVSNGVCNVTVTMWDRWHGVVFVADWREKKCSSLSVVNFN